MSQNVWSWQAVTAALFMDDPDWAKDIPEMKSGGARCSLPDHSDCTPLDVEGVAAHLEQGGTLGRMTGYETRQGQLDMLRAIVRAFNGREHLMIEAGTGVGKSLAYLVPAVQWAVLNDTPVVIATATRNLQSQLMASDIPRAARTLGNAAGKLRVALLKGRSNYLCLRELGDLMHGGYYTYTPEERQAWDAFVPWFEQTKDGDLDTYEGPLREKLSCPGDECGGRRCPYFGKCFVQKARDRAARAHLIVANHALVLSEATADAAILPAFGYVVFDEAHDLEDVATDFFSLEFSKRAFQQALGRIERKGRRGRSHGVLATIDRQLKQGALRTTKAAHAVREGLTLVRLRLVAVQDKANELFELFERLFSPDPSAEIIRYRTAGGCRQYALNGLFRNYEPAEWRERDLTAALHAFEEKLAGVADELVHLSAAIDGATGADELPLYGDLSAQATAAAGALKKFLLDAKFVLTGSDEAHVFWVERVKERGRKGGASLVLTAAPLSVAEKMNALFYARKDSVVLCSATLRVGGKFDYMARRLGLVCAQAAADNDETGGTARFRVLTASSPFDYLQQALVLAPDFLPDPSAAGAAYAAKLAPFLANLFRTVHGRGLVLFTSYEMMRAVAEAARPALAAAGLALYVQGDGLSREAMVRLLKEGAGDAATGGVVLFGAQSFWEGVDVSGAALSCVVIARLPFPQVGEPIVEARAEKVEEAGGSSFRDYLLPQAVIQFRQGFGRLIRSKGDRGVVIVADSRIVSKNYGAIFKKSIPASVHTVRDENETLARTESFFTVGPI